jgi:glycosyltransferase involved in cell wall biosynthesis
MQPIVSVIIPFQSETTELKECLESLKSQTFKNFEIILIADGASEAAIDIANKFEWSLKKLVLIPISVKQSHARNIGLAEAQGKYIAIQDADDCSLPKRFELQVNYLEKHPNISVLGGAAKLKNAEYKWDVYSRHQDICDQLAINNPMIHSTVMLRKEIFDNHSYDNTFNTAEDYALFTKIKDEYKLANLSDSLLVYNKPKPQKPSSLDQRMKARILREQNNEGILEKYVTALHYFCELANPIENHEMVYLKNWFELNGKNTVFNDQYLRYGLKFPSHCTKIQLIKAWVGSKLMCKPSVIKRLIFVSNS